jgi:hypothetical protein
MTVIAPVDIVSILSKAEETGTNKSAPQSHILSIFKSEVQPVAANEVVNESECVGTRVRMRPVQGRRQ